MAVVGRGKGRGFAEIRETSLRRPGQPLSLKFNDICNLIDNLVICDGICITKIDVIAQKMRETLKNNTTEEVFEVLYNQALEDREFCFKLGIVCSNYRLYSIENNQMRRVILGITQRNYDEREEVKKRSMVHFRNAIIFLGELYNSLYVVSAPLQVLVRPLLDYLEMLLENAEEEDIEIIMTQLCLNGYNFTRKWPDKMEEFIMQVRTMLINRNLSARSRGMLLYIIELENKEFKVLSKKLEEFYTNELGVELFINVKRLNPNSVTNANLKDHVNYKEAEKSTVGSPSAGENSESAPMKANKPEKNVDIESDKKSGYSTVNEKPSVPRAIRGTGATDSTKDKSNKKSPRARKDKLANEPMCSAKQNTNSKVWGHDDRFDKDYD